jgi:cobalt-zinc-cadmium efflux system membrane fusion protein
VTTRAPAWLLVLPVIAGAGCGRESPPPPAAARQTTTDTAAPGPTETPATLVSPKIETRPSSLETSGKVQFNEDELVRVNAPVTGRVVEVLAKPGDVVEADQPLFVLDSPDLGQAKSDYAKAVTDVERADKAFSLAKELYEAKAVAQKEVREAESDYRKAVAERERAVSRLRTLGVPATQLTEIAARTDTSTRLAVTSPRSGVVVERNVTSGQVVAYGQSDNPVNVFVIANLSTMWVIADVYEPDIPKIRQGETVVVTPPCCPNERYEGRVSYISDVVDKETRTVKVRAVVPNRGRTLKAEMFVRVAIRTGSRQVLTLPQSAVHREYGQTFVIVQKAKDDYERRPIKIGADLDGSVEVLGGVTPSDHVVGTGSILLKRSAK